MFREEGDMIRFLLCSVMRGVREDKKSGYVCHSLERSVKVTGCPLWYLARDIYASVPYVSGAH